MARKKTTNEHPIHPPPSVDDEHDDDQDDPSEIAAQPSAPPKKKRQAQPSTSVTEFGSMPLGTTHFRLKRRHPDGREEYLEAPVAPGRPDVSRWPIAMLTVEWIASTFGAGVFRVRFMGPTPKGTCSFKGWGEYFTLREPEAPAYEAPATSSPAAAPPVGSSPMAEAIALFGFISNQAAQQTQQTIAMATAMMTAARPPAATGPDPRDRVIADLREELRSVRELVLTRAPAGPLEDDDEDDDDDDDDDDGPFAPGVDAFEAVKADAFNKIWNALGDNAPELLSGFATFLKEKAGAHAPRVVVTSSRPNGPPPAPVDSSTTEATSDRPNT